MLPHVEKTPPTSECCYFRALGYERFFYDLFFFGNAPTNDLRINLLVSSLINEAHCQKMQSAVCKPSNEPPRARALLQFFIGLLIRVFRKKAISVTDKRVRTMNEVLTCIKLIKMYAWEESFEKKITGTLLDFSSQVYHRCLNSFTSKL